MESYLGSCLYGRLKSRKDRNEVEASQPKPSVLNHGLEMQRVTVSDGVGWAGREWSDECSDGAGMTVRWNLQGGLSTHAHFHRDTARKGACILGS